MYLQASFLLGHFHNGLLLHGSLCCVCKKWWQSGKKNASSWTLWSYTTDFPHEETLWPSRWQLESGCSASHHHEGRAPLRVRHHHWPCLSLGTWPPNVASLLLCKTGHRVPNGSTLKSKCDNTCQLFFYEFQKACVVCHELLFGGFISPKKKARKKDRKWSLNK